MALQWTPYHPLLVVSVVLAGVIAILAWRRREHAGAKPLTFFALAAGAWTIAKFGSLASPTAAGKETWMLAEVVCSTAVPATWAFVALEYSGRESLVNRQTLGLFAVEPLLVLAAVLLAPETVFQAVGREQVAGGYYLATESLGTGFVLHVAYSYTLVLVTTALVFVVGLRERDLAWQSLVVGLAVVPLLVANVAWLLELTPQGTNPTNVAFVLSALLLLVGIYRHRVLDVMPAVRSTARRQLFADLPDAVVAVNTSGTVVDVNRLAADVFEVDREAVVGTNIVSSFPELADDAPDELVRDTGGTSRYYDVREAVLGSEDDPKGRLYTLRDVTDRRQTEERYRTLLDRSLDIITVIDETGTITYESPSIEPVLGYDSADLVGESAFDYIHPEDREAVFTVITEALDDPGKEDGVEFRFRDASGSWRWLEARGRNLLHDPVVEGLVVNSRDVTERKQRQQLVDVMRRLLRHNLRNDMTLVRGYADALASDANASDRTEYARTIAELAEKTVDRSDTLNRTIDDVAAADDSECDFAAIVGAAVDRVRHTHPCAVVDVDVEDDIAVRGGRSLQLAVEELVENAVEHGSDTGSPTHSSAETAESGVTDGGDDEPVVVTLQRVDEHAVLTVADDGPGIPQAELDPLLIQSETPLEHTSGLGLWVANWVVRRLGGDISFDSEQGTRVVVQLPLADTAQ
ncbi:histidine kinase N-terminal 7TM domain-containing protein [Haloarchaeobius sp. DFWS5]|uniref:histidine kinase N-terminal 7TM domain-containing protein n=1 Tax=Haloarchaeobius sp. DFWS5 TaxID=3446114 RepID=UPI003EBC1FAB